MNKRLISVVFAALALFAGPTAFAAANPADPPGLTMTSTNAKNAPKAELLAVTLPDKRHGTDAVARFKEPQYSSVTGGNANPMGIMPRKLAGVTRLDTLDTVRTVSHITSGFSPGIGAGSGDHSAADNVLTIDMGGGSGGAVAQYSIAGIKTS